MYLDEKNKKKILNKELKMLKESIEEIWYVHKFPYNLEYLNSCKETWKNIDTEKFKEEYYNKYNVTKDLKKIWNIDAIKPIIKSKPKSIEINKKNIWKIGKKELIDSNYLILKFN